MMNGIQVFKHDEFGAVRTIVKDGEPWFVGKDVAAVLGYANGSRDVNRHVDEEDRFSEVLAQYQNGTLVKTKTILINESGLYSLIMGSKLPKAKAFKRWVTAEVLPSIRKHGVYAKDEILNNPDLFIEVLKRLKAEKEQRLALEEEKREMLPKAIFADSVAASDSTILIGELAKILKGNGFHIGQNRLFRWMRDNGFLIRRKGSDYNLPTQRSMELGLFRIKETAITHSDGHVSVNKTTKVTGKGQQYFINHFMKKLQVK